MSSNRQKRNAYRTRSEGALPMSEQLKAVAAMQEPLVDPVGEDLGDVTQEPELITPDEAVAMTNGEQVDVVALMKASADGLVENLQDQLRSGEYQEPPVEHKAVLWMFRNDVEKATRWSKALEQEPDRLVYDLFPESDLDFTGVDFAGDDFTTATPWIVEQYENWRTEQASIRDEPTDGSDDALNVESSSTDSNQDDLERTQYYADLRSRYTIPLTWSDAGIDDWVAKEGYNLGLTERGNFVYDPTRFSERALETYTTDELLDAIQGKLSDNYADSETNIAALYRQREPVDPAWSARDLIDWLVQELEPQKTSTGAWKNDVTRARRLAQDWTTQELTAWAKGELQAVGETTDIKLAIELNKRLDLGVITPTIEDVKRVYEKSLNNAVKIVGQPTTADTPTNLQPEPAPVAEPTIAIPQGLTAMNAAYLKTQTDRYAKACAPGRPITPEVGAKEQKELDNLFRYVLKIDDPAGFGSAMIYIRDFFAANREGLFDPQYAFRFTGSLRVDGNVQETHVNLLNILQVYTDPNKSARKQIDLPFLLRKFPTERQEWLLEFFQRYC